LKGCAVEGVWAALHSQIRCSRLGLDEPKNEPVQDIDRQITDLRHRFYDGRFNLMRTSKRTVTIQLAKGGM
jgi:hypothetical protein